MSGDSSTEEKTKPASQKKLRDARKRGEVAKSVQLAGAISMLMGMLCLMAISPWIALQIANFWQAVLRLIATPSVPVLTGLAYEGFFLVMQLSLPVVAVAAATYFLAMWMQVGPVFSLDPVVPKLDRLDPVAGLKKMFSVKSLVKTLIMILRLVVVAMATVLVWLFVLPDALRVIYLDTAAALAVAKMAISRLLLWCGGIFLLLGFAELVFERWQFLKDQRMGESEVRREGKDDNVSPELKHLRQEISQELMHKERLVYVKLAALVVENQSGQLVVLLYRQSISPSPVFLMKASGLFADEVRAIARADNIHFVTDDELLSLVYPMSAFGTPLAQDAGNQVLAHLGLAPI